VLSVCGCGPEGGGAWGGASNRVVLAGLTSAPCVLVPDLVLHCVLVSNQEIGNVLFTECVEEGAPA
jgi:hypothetical protein